MTTTSQANMSTNTTAFAAVGTSGVSGGADVGASDIGSGAPNTANQNSNTNTNSSGNICPNNLNQKNSSSNNARSDNGKRRKYKTRSNTTPNVGYMKDHLDAWLENCLKDASNTQLSSSSEFLDYNPTASSKPHIPQNLIAQQQQQQQQQHQQQNQQSSTLQQDQTYGSSANSYHQQHLQSQQQQQQQAFAMRGHSNSQPQTPVIYTNSPFNQGFQRGMPMPNFPKQFNTFSNRYSTMFPSGFGGGRFYPHNDGSQDFASLPPIVNMIGGSSEHDNNSTDVLDGSGSNPNISRGFRFSDPCLLNPSDNDSKLSGQNTPDRRNTTTNEMENNKFFAALMEQINLLHETNSKICRNLHEITKVDIEALKHAPNWGMRHRRDSLSGLSSHSQPLMFGGGFATRTQSPAPTFHSGPYTPGMMTDVVREVKEAARVREDALLNRVKAMVEERQWSTNECNLRMMRDIEELKSQIHHLRLERKEANKRLSHLETENKYMRQMLASIFNNRHAADIIYENEALRTRKSVQHTHPRRSQSMNLNYGTIHHQHHSQQQDEPLHIIETNPAALKTGGGKQQRSKVSHENRNSTTSSDGNVDDDENESVKGENERAETATLVNGSFSKTELLMSPPNFALVLSPVDGEKKKKVNLSRNSNEIPQEDNQSLEKVSTDDLRRELDEAIAARKKADNRIIALEKLVNNLQVNVIHNSPKLLIPNGDSDFNNMGEGCNRKSASFAVTTSTPIGYRQHMVNAATTTSPTASAATYLQGNRYHQAHVATAPNASATSQPQSKLSVAGPITDL